MPWQDHVLDVALEYDPGTGRFAYQTIILTVPRQSGKTLLVLLVILLRIVGTFGRQQVAYTAQRLLDAVEKLEEDWLPILEAAASIWKRDRDFFVRLGNRPRLKWRNGSTCRLSATTKSSGHSKTLDLVMIDEAFIHEDHRIDAGFGPPMATRAEVAPGVQKWVVSTAGTWKSLYLNGKRDTGREVARSGDTTSGICYFEWSAPEESETYDESVWWSCMPALGRTIGIEFVRKEAAEMDEVEFRRAYLNITVPDTRNGDEALDLDRWARQVVPGPQVEGRLVLGLAMPPSRSHGALGIAGRRPEGDFYVEHTHTREGTGWVVDEVREFMAKVPGIVGVGVDAGGPAASEIAPLEAAGVTVFRLNSSSHANAAGLLHDRLAGGKLWHLSGTPLDDAVAGATKRPLGDRWAFDRRSADVDIAPLEAVTMALGALVALPAEVEPDVDYAAMYEQRGGLFSWEE